MAAPTYASPRPSQAPESLGSSRSGVVGLRGGVPGGVNEIGSGVGGGVFKGVIGAGINGVVGCGAGGVCGERPIKKTQNCAGNQCIKDAPAQKCKHCIILIQNASVGPTLHDNLARFVRSIGRGSGRSQA